MPHCDNPACKVKALPYRLLEKNWVDTDDNPRTKRFYAGILCHECGYTHRISPIMNHKRALAQVKAHNQREDDKQWMRPNK